MKIAKTLAQIHVSLAAAWLLTGCAHSPSPVIRPLPAPVSAGTNNIAKNVPPPREKNPSLRRTTYTPRVYPVDERGFSPVDAALAKAFAREEIIPHDADGSLNPYVLRVIAAYPLDGSYQ